MAATEPVLGREWRSVAVFAFDLVVVVLAWLGAYSLGRDFSLPPEYLPIMWEALFLLVPAQAMIFRLTGLYRGIWFFSGLPDLQRILQSVALSAVLVAAAALLLAPAPAVPHSVLVLYPLLLLVAMGGGRAAYRMWKEHQLYAALGTKGKPVLVIGAGRTGASLIQELSRSGEWRVVGFLDDDPAKQRRELMGQRILGPLNELAYWAKALRAHHVILAVPSVTDEVRQRISTLCVRAGVTAYTVPSEQLLLERDRLDHVRPIDLEDLLGRSPVRIDTPEVRELISGRAVMVTGAGGSIGGELCRQIGRLQPGQLILFDNNEFGLYSVCEEMAACFPEVAVVPLGGDVKDAAWLGEVMRRYAPSVVFHAAAYKHVPLMEEHNAWQAVRNNVLGTYVVAMAAKRAEVPKFVLVSTDKAVNPTNVMGATKRLAEMVCQALHEAGGATRFEMVRFGNVLGSSGSVIPKFRGQIAKGGPVTVTHPEITRFFMSIPEASQLVLEAAAMGVGGEIFVLDMGKPVRIADLARDMIRLSGRSEEEVRIVYTGLRPGEKLFEELLTDDEHARPTHHPKLRIAKARPVSPGWLDELLVWLKPPVPRSDAEVRRDLRRWVPEYQPNTPPTLRPVPDNQESGVL
jgi:FlaA1/EpsC-like NDP-sugar epimerase